MAENDILTAMGTEKPVWIQIRISEPLKAALQAQADNEHMSLSGFLLFAAAQYSPAISEAVLRDGAAANKAMTGLPTRPLDKLLRGKKDE